jgi:hypothetical protein
MKAARAGIALAAACLFLSAGSTALAKSKKRKHHPHKSQRQPRQIDEGGGPEAEGRAHLKRANALADKGDCQTAIDEYTKAYELLHDPVVLFNRAECFRIVGDADTAVDDYREFLEKVPSAPNRAAIEAKIAAIEGAKPPRAPAAEAKPKVPPPPAAEAKPKVPPPPVAEAKPKAPPPPVAETRPKAPPPAVAPPPPVEVAPPPIAPPVVVAPPAPPASPEPAPQPAATVHRTAPHQEAGRSGTRPWVWVALSVLAVGVGVAGYLVFRPHDQPPPDTALGNYRF